MSELAISLVAFACIFGGTMLGMIVRTFLPEHHLSDESTDAVKLGAGTIATMAALVLGLLIASAKGSFDTMSSELRKEGSRIILLRPRNEPLWNGDEGSPRSAAPLRRMYYRTDVAGRQDRASGS